MLVKHVRELDEDSLARLMYEEQVKNDWPGLAREATAICKELVIEDVNETKQGIKEFSKVVKEAVRAMNEIQIKKEMGDEVDRMKKMKTMRKCSVSMKEYMRTGTLYSVRKTWEVKSYMLRVAGNYPGHMRYPATGARSRSERTRTT